MSAFSESLDRQYFVDGMITAYTRNVKDLSLREQFEADLEHLLDDRREVFKEGPLTGYLHEGDEDCVEELLIRCAFEAWNQMVNKPPGLFCLTANDPRKEMLALMWDIDHFVDTISEWTADAEGLLDSLEYVDKTSETMRLITQNYVNMRIKECQGLTKQEMTAKIRDLRIDKTMKR